MTHTNFDDEVTLYRPHDLFSKRDEHSLAKWTLAGILALSISLFIAEKTGFISALIELV